MSDLQISPAFAALLSTPESPQLGPGPRLGIEPLAACQARIDATLCDRKIRGSKGELIRAIALLWHDHHDAAHVIVQSLEDPDGSYIHGILHRREPDYSNARYWFQRVGTHPFYPALAHRAEAILQTLGQEKITKRLIARGEWDAFAMIDLCQESIKNPETDPTHRAIRDVQRAEFEILLTGLTA